LTTNVPRTPVVCLLPARNAAADLPGYFESAARFCDAVVALDDGSTDETRELLEACTLVEVLLANPRRESYKGWDDAANRVRLLDAAARLNPEWIISIDADERIDPSDAAALRDFLRWDALPGCAYGFRVFRMKQDLEHYAPQHYLWVYRLFAYEPGQSFPDQRLHFVPVPTSIPRVAWVNTTLRIQHLGGVTAARRRARFEKYRQADPNNDYQADYTNVLRDLSGDLLRWEPRPPGLHVLLAAAKLIDKPPTAGTKVYGTELYYPMAHGTELYYPYNGYQSNCTLYALPTVAELIDKPPTAGTTDWPGLSAIVISRNDEARIARTVASVVNQSCPEPFEVIVVASGTDRTAEVVRQQFPEVTLIELPRPALPGEARNAGLRVARGACVSFPGSHVELPPGSLAARLRAHRLGYPMVTGAVLNGTPTWAGWASYFLDHAANLPDQPATVLNGPPAHCSYALEPLLELGGFPKDLRVGEDTTVNTALFRSGYVAYRDPRIQLTHHSPCRNPWRLVRHHFVRGRGFGRITLQNTAKGSSLFNRRFLSVHLLRYLPRRLSWTSRQVWRWGSSEYRRRYVLVLPLVAAGSVAAWLGMWYEILRPAQGKLHILLGESSRNKLL
jgi:glycosyltransferase involved in cell wall biosynthesis